MTTTQRNRLAVIRFGLLVVVVLALGIGLAVAGTDEIRSTMETAADSQLSLVVFIAVYAALVVIMAPGTAATITSALIFGFGRGLFVSLVGATLGAMVAFIISKTIGREGARALLGKRLQSIDEFVTKREFLSIFVLRLLPVVPFNGLNYAAGLSAVRFSRYVPATVLGILPGTALTTFTTSRADDPTSPAFMIAIVGVVIAVVGSGFLARRFAASRSETELAETGSMDTGSE